MSIVKSKHTADYTVLPNEIFKQNLSIPAIGLLAKLLSLPKDWVIYKTQLYKQFNIGRDRLNTIFDELETKGYILKVQINTSKGATYEYVVYDKPFNGEPESPKKSDSPLTETPHTENPFTENPHLLNKEVQSKELLNKEILNTDISFLSKSDYELCVEYWLKVYHPDWIFNAVSGRKMKSIINKLKSIMRAGEKAITNESVAMAFKVMCENMPEFYKDKDLQVIDSKFNEIIHSIKYGNNSTKTKESQYRS